MRMKSWTLEENLQPPLDQTNIIPNHKYLSLFSEVTAVLRPHQGNSLYNRGRYRKPQPIIGQSLSPVPVDMYMCAW